MKKLIIFGTGQIAELAHYYFTNDSKYEVVAFTVDKEYIQTNIFFGLPLYDFENIEAHFSTEDTEMFVALSYSKMNNLRKEKAEEAKQKGFYLASYISTKATIFDNVQVGEHCFILENNTIQPFVEIGSNNILWSGNHIGHHSKIGHNNFISSHVVISGNTVIENHCFIGVNATCRDGITIATGTLIGAGAFINRDTKEWGVYKNQVAELASIKSNEIRGM